MKRNVRLWRTLERVPGLAAVKSHWKQLLKADFRLMAPFLQPTEEVSNLYPCSKNPNGFHDIIYRWPGDYIIDCKYGCPSHNMNKTHLIIWRLNEQALNKAIASALKIEHEELNMTGLPMTKRIGLYKNGGPDRHPVYLTVQKKSKEFHYVLTGLIAENDTPFILLAPTRNFCNQTSNDLIKRRKVCFLPLSEGVAITEDGTFSSVFDFKDWFYVPPPPPKQMKLAFPKPSQVDQVPNVFKKQGQMWLITYKDETVIVKNLKGFAYLFHLISNPEEEFHAAQLMAVINGQKNAFVMGSAGAILDEEAINAYRSRVQFLEEQYDEADEHCDLLRKEKIQTEIEALRSELRQALGLGGRVRLAKNDEKNCLNAVGMNISRALKILKNQHHRLWKHLNNSVRRGRYISYVPERPTTWK